MVAMEVLLSAVIAGNDDVYGMASEKMSMNTYAIVENNALAAFAQSVHDNPSGSDVINTAFLAIDIDNLRPMGLANALALAKKGGVDLEQLGWLEMDVIEGILVGKAVERPTDYDNAYHYVKTLTTKPIINPERVGDALAYLKQKVLAGKYAEPGMDPWGLGDTIKEFQERDSGQP